MRRRASSWARVVVRGGRGAVGAYADAAPRAGAAFLLSSAGLIYLSLLVPGYIRADWIVPFALTGLPCLVLGGLLLRRRSLVEAELLGLALYGDLAIVLSGFASLDRSATTAGALLGLPTLFTATFLRPRWLLAQSVVAVGCAWTITLLTPAAPAVHLIRTVVLVVACICPAVIVQLLRRHLDRAVLTDPLTHLANRRGLEVRIGEQVARARRTGLPLGCLLADVDHFKQINDKFGHHVGDLVLRRVAGIVAAGVRPQDIVVRLGGEEIVVVMVAGHDQLHDVAQRIRRGVAEFAERPGVTVSIGGAVCTPDLDDDGVLDRLLQLADRRMYEAKRQGRNRVVVTDTAPGASAARGA